MAIAIKSALKVTPLDEHTSLFRYAPHPGSRLSVLAEKYGGEAPYWAYLWPGGSAIIQHMLRYPGIVAGRNVLDLGCGSGMVGIVAKRTGARRVVSFDSDPLARAACQLNGALNEVSVNIVEDDAEISAQKFDMILAGDMFYDADVASFSLRVFRSAHEKGAEVLIGDIGRPFLPRDALAEIATYKARDVGSNSESHTDEAWVFEFRG